MAYNTSPARGMGTAPQLLPTTPDSPTAVHLQPQLERVLCQPITHPSKSPQWEISSGHLVQVCAELC